MPWFWQAGPVRVFWRRWVFLVLGGALFTPYAILGLVVVPLTVPPLASMPDAAFVSVAGAVMVLALAATSLLPIVRALEGAVAPMLLGGPAAGLRVDPAHTWVERRRTSAWYSLHTIVGAMVSLASAATATVVVMTLLAGMQGHARVVLGNTEHSIPNTRAPVLALGLMAGLATVVWGAGAAAARMAPWLLGQDPTLRIVALEQRTTELTERNRLARELHDTIGHALTVTTLQAGAARTVLHHDPAFVEQALLAIEQTGRTAAADLDDFLGLLREDASARVPQPTLGDLDELLASHRQTGLPLTLKVEGDLTAVPAVISREVYRIVQEGLTNVQRHAGAVPTEIRIALDAGLLTAQVSNPAGHDRSHHLRVREDGDGHGLTGVRERVRLLGGRVEAGASDGAWLLRVTVPTGVRP